MGKYLFSIIIPHYSNDGDTQLLNRCVNSIPERDDIQIIVIDNSQNPIEKQKIKRTDVELCYSPSGRGAGGARNEGLKRAKGLWLLFADADDFFTEGCDAILRYCEHSNADIIVFDTCSVSSDTLAKTNKRERVVDKYVKEKDDKILRYMHHTVWGKVFKKELIDKYNILFQEIPAWNDAFFAGKAGVYADKIDFFPVAGYCSTIQVGSISTIVSTKTILSKIKVCRDYNELLKENNVHPKYWLNQLAPLSHMKSLDGKLFLSNLKYYIIHTPIKRIFYDMVDSGVRNLKRALGLSKDKEEIKIITVVKE